MRHAALASRVAVRMRLSSRCAAFLLVAGACASARPVAERAAARARDGGAALPPAADRAAWRARLRWPPSCEADPRIGAEAGRSGVTLFALPAARILVEVQCGRGAYQASFLYYVVNAGAGAPSAESLRFPTFDGVRWRTEQEIAGLPSFDEATREMEIFSKDRGLGDCGRLLRYGFPGGVPTLLWLRMRLCTDTLPEVDAAPDPKSWPLVPLDSVMRTAAVS